MQCVILQRCKQHNVFNAFALMLVNIEIDPRKERIVQIYLKHSCLVLLILRLLVSPMKIYTLLSFEFKGCVSSTSSIVRSEKVVTNCCQAQVQVHSRTISGPIKFIPFQLQKTWAPVNLSLSLNLNQFKPLLTRSHL